MLLPDLVLSGSIECQAVITHFFILCQSDFLACPSCPRMFLDPSAEDDEARETASDIIDRTHSGGKHRTKAFYNNILKKCFNNNPRCGGESAEEENDIPRRQVW
ncbi:unnamed protein product [Aspergillus oryzae RIB40]|uniref:DNA, SC003 n=2 Tax=Aspergillus oryzae TaxID=5062 RepID=Q2UJ77_ASPOR|nr:unnamed protein product [Aspergillus oryzae RIB40]EIT83541.1 hypothetical protein Ao3042_05097 [Aspergillus oryzae 3.042]KDE78058.1 hypothetical protein AO1008_04224 [Aspergillus oryzae 100-8]BAE58388.1 unnamed protein product [Aspergillus oryzae RIB40]|eukprot:EIT83541.1 hypothetical protein Ao3042_05097 [Aspergillus oryzae 3.042]